MTKQISKPDEDRKRSMLLLINDSQLQ